MTKDATGITFGAGSSEATFFAHKAARGQYLAAIYDRQGNLVQSNDDDELSVPMDAEHVYVVTTAENIKAWFPGRDFTEAAAEAVRVFGW